MIVVPIIDISFRRVSGAVPKDCRRRVEQVEIKSAPTLLAQVSSSHRGAQSVRGATKWLCWHVKARGTSRSCELLGDTLERRDDATAK